MPKSYKYFTIGLLAAAVLAVAAYLLIFAPANFRGESQSYVVASGNTVSGVMRELASKGILRSAVGGQIAWRLSGATILRPGSYTLSANMSAWSIASILAGEISGEKRVTIPEGYTISQIAAVLDDRGILPESEFLDLANNFAGSEYPVLASRPAGHTSLEGYLFPDTYNFFPDQSGADIVDLMLSNLSRRLESIEGYAASSSLSDHQLLTLASLVEREAKTNTDRKMIAGVLMNRIEAGMRLDVDATVRYIFDNWDKPLTQAELNSNSPYNTRKFAGLPPGPICNPGRAALAAVLSPTSSDYLYYLTAPDGTTYYATTLEQHNQYKATYLR